MGCRACEILDDAIVGQVAAARGYEPVITVFYADPYAWTHDDLEPIDERELGGEG